MSLVLASASPRRKELLGLFGIPFSIRVADIDETMDPGRPPFDEVGRVSRAKALAVRREEGDVVIKGKAGAELRSGRRQRRLPAARSLLLPGKEA